MSLSELAKAANPIQAILEVAMKVATFNSLFFAGKWTKIISYLTIAGSRE
ncbi:MAG: hypothetical protein ACKVG9_10810 [Rhodospirillales bacterium]|jgi:hypothetical protein